MEKERKGQEQNVGRIPSFKQMEEFGPLKNTEEKFLKKPPFEGMAYV